MLKIQNYLLNYHFQFKNTIIINLLNIFVIYCNKKAYLIFYLQQLSFLKFSLQKTEDFKLQQNYEQQENNEEKSEVENLPEDQYNLQQDKAITLYEIKKQFSYQRNSQQNDFIQQYKQYRITACLEATKYPLVHLCCNNHYKIVSKEDTFNLYWYDWDIEDTFFQQLLPYQKINHWPSMYNITRKDSLARNLNRAQHFLPQIYNFSPKTFYLPSELSVLQKFIQDNPKQKTFIIKPPASAQGKGIKLIKINNKTELLQQFCYKDEDQQYQDQEEIVVQEYLENPYLLNGYKFDLRIYVILLQVTPFPIIVWYDDGMARFCTEKYQKPNKENINNMFMHLTNYALNKQNSAYIKNKNANEDDEGSKQGLHAVLQKIKEDGGDPQKIINKIQDICISTIFTILPTLQQTYSSLRPDQSKLNTSKDPYQYQNIYFGSNCFEILGFDILITNDFEPHLIEVNHSPSFSCDTELDIRIKKRLIDGVLSIINCQQADKIVYKDFINGKFYQQQNQYIQNKKQSQIIPKSYIRNINNKKVKINTKSFSNVMQHYEQVINNSNGLFKLIYPLSYGQEDKYRKILFQIKNNFVSEEFIKTYNQFIPVMPKDYYSQKYQSYIQNDDVKIINSNNKQSINNLLNNKNNQTLQQFKKNNQFMNQNYQLTYQQRVEFGNPKQQFKLINNQSLPSGTPKPNIQQYKQILQSRLQILKQEIFLQVINNIFDQVEQLFLKQQ